MLWISRRTAEDPLTRGPICATPSPAASVQKRAALRGHAADGRDVPSQGVGTARSGEAPAQLHSLGFAIVVNGPSELLGGGTSTNSRARQAPQAASKAQIGLVYAVARQELPAKAAAAAANVSTSRYHACAPRWLRTSRQQVI
jgi:hypothetical protein